MKRYGPTSLSIPAKVVDNENFARPATKSAPMPNDFSQSAYQDCKMKLDSKILK